MKESENLRIWNFRSKIRCFNIVTIEIIRYFIPKEI